MLRRQVLETIIGFVSCTLATSEEGQSESPPSGADGSGAQDRTADGADVVRLEIVPRDPSESSETDG